MYYYTANGRRFAISYPAEEYLADVEAAAKEKAEAGISSFFLSADMLANAVLTVNPDQSVSAVMDFDGTTQEKNIFHQIKSVYNDDLSVMMNGEFLSCSLAVTLDRFNYLTSYTLTVTAEIESNGTRALATYAIQYHFDYSESQCASDKSATDSFNSVSIEIGCRVGKIVTEVGDCMGKH